MATSDKFNLENARKEWTASLASTGQVTSENLKELEGHLIDEIDQMDQTVLTGEERFIVAKHRIGSADIISSAFQRSTPISFQRFSWLCQAIGYFLIFRALSLTAISLTNYLFYSFNSESQLVYLTLSLVLQIGALSVVFLTYRRVGGFGPKLNNAVRSNTIVLSALIISILVHFSSLYLMDTKFSASGRFLHFPLIESLLSYLVPVSLFIIFAVVNLKEWLKERRFKLRSMPSS